jgi:hypothetical protein
MVPKIQGSRSIGTEISTNLKRGRLLRFVAFVKMMSCSELQFRGER